MSSDDEAEERWRSSYEFRELEAQEAAWWSSKEGLDCQARQAKQAAKYRKEQEWKKIKKAVRTPVTTAAVVLVAVLIANPAAMLWYNHPALHPASCGLSRAAHGLMGLPSMECSLLKLMHEHDLGDTASILLSQGVHSLRDLRTLTHQDVDRMMHIKRNPLPEKAGGLLKQKLQTLIDEIWKLERFAAEKKKQEASATLLQMIDDRMEGVTIEGVRTVLERGAAIDVKGAADWTLLMRASRVGNREIVRLLLEQGACVNAQSANGYTALMWVSIHGDLYIAQLLLEQGAIVGIQSADGYNALICASERGHIDIVRLLLDQSAAIDVQTENGHNALSLAKKNKHTETEELLSLHSRICICDSNTDLQAFQKETCW